MTTDPDTLVDVLSARSEFEASVMVEALKARDIPAFAISNAGMTLQGEVAASSPFRVSVRRKDVETAKEVLRSVKADSVDIDWSEVDVGVAQEAPPATPAGKQEELEPLGWLSGWGAPVLIVAALLWLLWNAFARNPA